MAVTTLILGAGLGLEYGFPDGKGLLKMIHHELDDHETDLKQIFEYHPAATVDELVADYPDHANRIRKVVTKILKKKESESLLNQKDNPNTYRLMINQIATAIKAGDTVNVITFNYDRSLQFLIFKINQILPVDKRIDPKIIIPIYGRLAPLHFEDSDKYRSKHYHEYGSSEGVARVSYITTREDDIFSRERVYKQKELENSKLNELFRDSTVNFIGEVLSKPFINVAPILEKSDQIFFLGVGYHAANMKILGFDFSRKRNGKLIAGTGLNLSPEKIKSLKEDYPAISRIEPVSAYEFLNSVYNVAESTKNMQKAFPRRVPPPAIQIS